MIIQMDNLLKNAFSAYGLVTAFVSDSTEYAPSKSEQLYKL